MPTIAAPANTGAAIGAEQTPAIKIADEPKDATVVP